MKGAPMAMGMLSPIVFQKVYERAGVVIEGRNFLSDPELVTSVSARLVVSEDGAGFFEFMINLGSHHKKAMACQVFCSAPDGRGDLIDLRVENYRGILSLRDGPEKMGPYWPAGGGQVNVFVVAVDQGGKG